MNKNILSYALDFVSFLIERTINLNNIRGIILFGSVSRGEASQESDVDIFIDVINEQEKFENGFKKIKNDFFKSNKFKNYWQLKDITNEINLTIGKLDKWKELKNSIISNGIILYGKYYNTPENAVHKTLFCWENIKPESKRVLLSKRLFGYSQQKKKYPGLVSKFNGKKIGKGMILVPSESANEFTALFRNMKITVKIKKLVEYG